MTLSRQASQNTDALCVASGRASELEELLAEGFINELENMIPTGDEDGTD